MSGHRKQNKGLHLAFCEECGRFFDVRSGCEADIRFDERARLREKVEAMAADPHGHFPIPRGLQPKKIVALALRKVLALLAEPGEQ